MRRRLLLRKHGGPLTLRERLARFVRSLFSSRPPDPWGDETSDRGGGLGVREPRRPLRPTLSGAVALEAPPTERSDIRAVGQNES